MGERRGRAWVIPRWAFVLLGVGLTALAGLSGCDNARPGGPPEGPLDAEGPAADQASADLTPGPDAAPTDGGVPDSGSDGGGDAGPPVLDLQAGAWMEINDVGESRTFSPKVTLKSLTPTSASVSAAGTGTPQCTCNAQHAVLALPASFDCATATLAFDYDTTGAFGGANGTSVLVRFLSADGQVGYLTASTQSGASACAANLPGGQFPAPPALKVGRNTLALRELDPAVNGVCAGTFSRLDLALEAYACTAADTSAATLSNVRVY